MDRAFRYGQQRDVYVYRLLSSGTLEGTCHFIATMFND